MVSMFSFLILLFSFCAKKPTEVTTLGSIYGVVYDESNNNTLAGVNISISDIGNRITSSDGSYNFSELEEDIYSITATKSGYVTATEQVEVVANKNKEVNFFLETAQPAQLVVSPTSLNFGQTESSLKISVDNAGDEELSWQVSSDQSWLTIFPSTGVTNSETDEITATINRSVLEVGNYTGNLTFSSNGGSFTLPVAMEVTPAVLVVSANSLDFGSDKDQLSLIVSNSGNGDLNWNATSNQDWITMDKSSGTISTSSIEILVSVDRTGLEPNTYNGSISIQSNGGNADITISMTILDIINIVEHFYNLDDWTNTTNSTYDDAWVIDSDGYNGSCAKSVCGGYGYGDILTQTFNFSKDVSVKFYAKNKYSSDAIKVFLIMDDSTLVSWPNYNTTEWTEVNANIPAGEHEVKIKTDYSGTIYIDELEITE